MVIWSVVGRDVVVRGIRVRDWLVARIPEWYEVVVGVPCLDVCVIMRYGCE